MRGAGGQPLFANSGAELGLVLEERQAPPAARAGVALRAPVLIGRRLVAWFPVSRRPTPTASAGQGAS